MTERMSEKVVEFTQDYYKLSLRDDDKFCIERYVDYSDKFPENDIQKILSSDNPLETFDEIVMDWNIKCDDWQYEDNFWGDLENFCYESNIDAEEAHCIVMENFYWAYPDSFLNPIVNTVWTVQCGDLNHDFVLHNVLNYDKDVYTDSSKGLLKEAGLHWLAKQQGYLDELQTAIKGKSKKIYFTSSQLIEKLRKKVERRKNGRYYQKYLYDREMLACERITNRLNFVEWIKNRDGEEDLYVCSQLEDLCKECDISLFHYEWSKFTRSCVTELENCTSHMNALTFLVKMPLQTAIEIKEKINVMEKSKGFDKYNPLNTKGIPYGYIVLGKNTNVGLYDSYQGGGSVLEIELEKDVKLPLQFLWNITDDKAIQDCYRMVDECWQDSIKEINLKEIS